MTRDDKSPPPDTQAGLDDEDRELMLGGVERVIAERTELREHLRAALAEVRRLRRDLRAIDDRVTLAVARVCRAVEQRQKRRTAGGE